MFRNKVSALIGAVALGLIGSAASAHSIQIFSVPSTSPGVPLPGPVATTNYSYDVYVTAGNQVNANAGVANGKGDFFTLVDFTGFTGVVVSTPSNWSLFNSSNIANTPAGAGINNGGSPNTATIIGVASSATVVDDAAQADLTFQYTGATNLVAGATNLFLGTFVINSTKNLFNLSGSRIVGADHQTSTGLPGQNADPYISPGDQALPVPLPAAAWGGMSLLGALGAGKMIRRRK